MKLFTPALLLLATVASAQTTKPNYPPAATQAILPPLVELPEMSRRAQIVAPKDHPFITACEASDFRESPSYDDTIAWLKKLVDAAPQQLKMVSLGKSPQGRDIWMVIASSERNFDPQSLKQSGKPTFLAQAGIHSGEIDGKDAGMMLLRDMTVRDTNRQLLQGANFLFVPIFSVDAHERRSPYSRSNQRGPEITGWRTTSRNLNLNRDYAKLDSPEMHAMVRAIVEWDPDLYYDIHVTDGADYQADITWGSNGEHAHSPAGATWLQAARELIARDLTSAGHVPGDLVFALDQVNFDKGLRQSTFAARYSHGYGDARHLPTVLVENHALKPFDRRVLGTYVLLESTMKLLGTDAGKQLRAAIKRDRAQSRDTIDLEFDDEAIDKSPTIDFAGVDYRLIPSAISGTLRIEWLGKPRTYRFPLVAQTKVVASASRPKAYYVPPAWTEVIDRLKLHGIRTETLDAGRAIDVTMYRVKDVKLMAEPFEGHVGIESCTPVAEKRRETFAPGTVRVPMDQPLAHLAAVLLEPASADSFLRWGFFNEILQRTEYMDGYILEPMAERMMKDDPKLAEQFQKKLAEDEDFAASPQKRLDWFYSKTPFYDERWKLYPVAREED